MSLEALPVDFLFHMTASLVEITPISPGPHADRLVMGVGDGGFEGPRMRGRLVVGPGSEWATARADGSLRVDVRLVLETDDGARILMTYGGVARPQSDGSVSIRTAPVFETGAEPYAWLHHVQAVGIGVGKGRGVEYDVYAIR